MPSVPQDRHLMLRGSLITLKRKCGKPTCHCAKGKPHTSPALSYSFKGKTRILTLRSADIPEVRAALRRYRDALQALQQQAHRGIRQLSARLRHEKGGRGHES